MPITNEYKLIGKYHREDGPAIELADGYKAWFINGKQVSEFDVMDKFNNIPDIPPIKSDNNSDTPFTITVPKGVKKIVIEFE